MSDSLTEVPKTTEKMSLEEAQKVLGKVVEVNEAEIAREENLAKVLGYSSPDVSRAMGMIADKLFPWWDGHQGGLMKQWGEQAVLLSRAKDIRTPKLETLILTLAEQNEHKMPSRSIVDTTVRLDERGMLLHQSSFQDQRSATSVRLTPEGEFKEIWRGVRWLAYNLAHWRDDFKLPEELPGGVVPTPPSEVADRQQPSNITAFPKTPKPRF